MSNSSGLASSGAQGTIAGLRLAEGMPGPPRWGLTGNPYPPVGIRRLTD